MDTFLDTYDLSKSNQDKASNSNRPLISSEITLTKNSELEKAQVQIELV